MYRAVNDSLVLNVGIQVTGENRVRHDSVHGYCMVLLEPAAVLFGANRPTH